MQVFSDQGAWYLARLGASPPSLFVRAPAPRRARRSSRTARCGARPAWGALLVSFFVGAALIAALVDIPLFARTTVYRDSQLMAALVLVRFLVALPVGAVRRRLPDPARSPAGVVTAVGMACAAVGFVLMAALGLDSRSSTRSPNVPLVLGGFGFGLALAPVNAAAARQHRRRRARGRQRAAWWSPGWSACWSASRR